MMGGWDDDLMEPAASGRTTADPWSTTVPDLSPVDIDAARVADGAQASLADSAAAWDEPPVLSGGTADDAGFGAAPIALAASPDPTALREALLAAGPAGARLEAGAVARLSGAALQVLLAAMAEARAAGADVAVINPSFAFLLTFEAYGFGADNEPFTVEYS
jgi:hypothetical protein